MKKNADEVHGWIETLVTNRVAAHTRAALEDWLHKPAPGWRKRRDAAAELTAKIETDPVLIKLKQLCHAHEKKELTDAELESQVRELRTGLG